MAVRTEVLVTNEVGLHARPAALFVQEAAKYQADVRVRNLTSDHDWVDAKSILGVLMLGASQGHIIEIQADGSDAEEAVRALEHLMREVE